MRNSLTAIVPCFNEAEVIEITYQRLHAVAKGLPVPCKILFVNDGSSDSTGELLDRIAASDSSVEVLHFSRNFGHQPAVCAGIEHCTTDMAVILDADLQDPPELIPEMIDTMVREEADVVYCVRRHRDGETFFKKFTAKVFYRVLNYMSEVSLPVDTGDFRLVSRRVINEFCRLPERQKYVRGLMAWVGFHQVPFYYDRKAREAGGTKYPLSKMISLSLISLLYFSTKPLKLALMFGFLAVVFSLGLLLWSFFGKIFGFTNADSGWTSLFVVVIFFSGVQLITIGLVGMYVGNIFNEVKRRPQYVVKREED